ncbi:unnamed protein product [Closterium sp. Naga37s-1]|nr:unnamed protein product [Closterium sp. Naga37s-1]
MDVDGDTEWEWDKMWRKQREEERRKQRAAERASMNWRRHSAGGVAGDFSDEWKAIVSQEGQEGAAPEEDASCRQFPLLKSKSDRIVSTSGGNIPAVSGKGIAKSMSERMDPPSSGGESEEFHFHNLRRAQRSSSMSAGLFATGSPMAGPSGGASYFPASWSTGTFKGPPAATLSATSSMGTVPPKSGSHPSFAPWRRRSESVGSMDVGPTTPSSIFLPRSTSDCFDVANASQLGRSGMSPVAAAVAAVDGYGPQNLRYGSNVANVPRTRDGSGRRLASAELPQRPVSASAEFSGRASRLSRGSPPQIQPPSFTPPIPVAEAPYADVAPAVVGAVGVQRLSLQVNRLEVDADGLGSRDGSPLGSPRGSLCGSPVSSCGASPRAGWSGSPRGSFFGSPRGDSHSGTKLNSGQSSRETSPKDLQEINSFETIHIPAGRLSSRAGSHASSAAHSVSGSLASSPRGVSCGYSAPWDMPAAGDIIRSPVAPPTSQAARSNGQPTIQELLDALKAISPDAALESAAAAVAAATAAAVASMPPGVSIPLPALSPSALLAPIAVPRAGEGEGLVRRLSGGLDGASRPGSPRLAPVPEVPHEEERSWDAPPAPPAVDCSDDGADDSDSPLGSPILGLGGRAFSENGRGTGGGRAEDLRKSRSVSGGECGGADVVRLYAEAETAMRAQQQQRAGEQQAPSSTLSSAFSSRSTSADGGAEENDPLGDLPGGFGAGAEGASSRGPHVWKAGPGLGERRRSFDVRALLKPEEGEAEQRRLGGRGGRGESWAEVDWLGLEFGAWRGEDLGGFTWEEAEAVWVVEREGGKKTGEGGSGGEQVKGEGGIAGEQAKGEKGSDEGQEKVTDGAGDLGKGRERRERGEAAKAGMGGHREEGGEANGRGFGHKGSGAGESRGDRCEGVQNGVSVEKVKEEKEEKEEEKEKNEKEEEKEKEVVVGVRGRRARALFPTCVSLSHYLSDPSHSDDEPLEDVAEDGGEGAHGGSAEEMQQGEGEGRRAGQVDGKGTGRVGSASGGADGSGLSQEGNVLPACAPASLRFSPSKPPRPSPSPPTRATPPPPPAPAPTTASQPAAAVPSPPPPHPPSTPPPPAAVAAPASPSPGDCVAHMAAFLRNFLDLSATPFLSLALPAATIVSCNDATCHTLGWPRQQLLSRKLASLLVRNQAQQEAQAHEEELRQEELMQSEGGEQEGDRPMAVRQQQGEGRRESEISSLDSWLGAIMRTGVGEGPLTVTLTRPNGLAAVRATLFAATLHPCSPPSHPSQPFHSAGAGSDGGGSAATAAAGEAGEAGEATVAIMLHVLP